MGSRPYNIVCYASENMKLMIVTLGLNNHHEIKSEDHGEELVEINLVARGAEPQPVLVNANFPAELTQALLILSQDYKDVFVSIYVQMLGLDPQQLCIDSTFRKEPDQ